MTRPFMSFGRSRRCIEGRMWESRPQHDDPYLEVDIGRCEECDGKGCDGAEQVSATGTEDSGNTPKDNGATETSSRDFCGEAVDPRLLAAE